MGSRPTGCLFKLEIKEKKKNWELQQIFRCLGLERKVIEHILWNYFCYFPAFNSCYFPAFQRLRNKAKKINARVYAPYFLIGKSLCPLRNSLKTVYYFLFVLLNFLGWEWDLNSRTHPSLRCLLYFFFLIGNKNNINQDVKKA